MSQCLLPVIAMFAVVLAGPAMFADEARNIEQLGELNESYVHAFNGHDPVNIGKLFVADGDYMLVTGDLLEGTEAIVAGHASFFSNNPKVKLEGKVLKRKFLTPDLVLSHGKWKATGGPPGVPNEGTWTAIQVHADGQWRYQTIRVSVPLKF